MTSSSTCELGMRCFVSVGRSCIRVSWLPFLRFFLAHGRGLFSCRAVDNIERLIPFRRPAVECRMAADGQTFQAVTQRRALTKPYQMDGLKQLLQSALDSGMTRWQSHRYH